MRPLTLPQSLALGVRDGELVPDAAREMTAGERLAVKFGGRVTAWVSMPHPATRATVKDRAAFLAWVRKTLPDEVETVEQVREGTQRQLLEAAKAGGWLNTATGAREPIPGVEVKAGDLVPSVHLEDCAAEVIGAAWQAGEIDLGGMLALPVAEGGAA